MKISANDLPMTMRRLIAASTLTYSDLEQRSGVPQRYIKRFKNGLIDDLSMDHAVKLCAALGIRTTFTRKS